MRSVVGYCKKEIIKLMAIHQKKLNEAWGTNYTSRDIGRALESLMPDNHHGKIMSNSDNAGKTFGRIK